LGRHPSPPRERSLGVLEEVSGPDGGQGSLIFESLRWSSAASARFARQKGRVFARGHVPWVRVPKPAGPPPFASRERQETP